MARDKKTRLYVVGMVLFALLIGVIAYNVSVANFGTNDFCVEGDNGNVLCMLKDNIGQQFAVGSNKFGAEVEAGESIRISETIEFTQSDLPFGEALIRLYENCPSAGASSCKIIEIFDVTSKLNTAIPKTDFYGTTVEQDYVFNAITIQAPVQAGDYWIDDSLRNDIGVPLDTSVGFGFTVVGEAVDCPDNDAGDWRVITTYADGSGKVEAKTSITYGDDPSCTEDRKTSYKTICSAGYVIKGTNSQVSNEKSDCVAEPVPEPQTEPEPQPEPEPKPDNGDTTQPPTSDDLPIDVSDNNTLYLILAGVWVAIIIYISRGKK